MRGLLALAALLLAAPGAQACSLILPEDHWRLVRAEDDRVLSNRERDFGWWTLDGRGFERLVTPFALSPPSVSPDGAWLAWQEAEGLGGMCEPMGGWMNARPLAGGETQVVRGASAWAYAAGPERLGVVYRDTRALTLHPWGDWSNATDVPLGGENAGLVVASPDGRWFAAHLPLDREVVVVDARAGRVELRIGEQEDVWGLAFSPTGSGLAIQSGRYGEFTQVQTVELPGGRVLGTARTSDVGSGLAWSPHGLVAGGNEIHYPGNGRVEHNATLRLYLDDALSNGTEAARVDGALAHGAPVFLPDGRLAWGVGGQLRILEPTGGTFHEAERPGGAWRSEVPLGGLLAAAALVIAARRPILRRR